jgi:ABC-2 type transport system ATP-binding protein
LDISEGEIFGLLGPNGGGKSTMFKIISTLLPPSAGTAEVFGKDVVQDPAGVRALIGVVFQSPSLDKKLSVKENLDYHGRIYGIGSNERKLRIQDLLERFHLSERSRDQVGTLSGGLARRVEIAKGMMHRPKLLLLDEPSTGLDPGARMELMVELRQVRREEGVTVLMTTHILEEAEDCDELAILDRGKIVARGTPDVLKSEISGEVLTIEADDLERLKSEIESRLGIHTELISGALRIEAPKAFELSMSLGKEFGDSIRSLRIGRPTLGDVFLRKTGRLFCGEVSDESRNGGLENSPKTEAKQ